MLELVAKRARTLIDARAVVVMLREGDVLRVRAAAGWVDSAAAVAKVPVEGTALGWVLTSQRSWRVSRIEPDILDPAPLGVPDASAALVVPLINRDRAVGLLAAFDRQDDPTAFRSDDEEALLVFATSAAAAVTTAKSVEADRLRLSIEAADAELVEAIHAAAAGKTYLNPALGARLAATPEQPVAQDDLSQRETDVLRLIALGHTNAEIGKALFLSTRTVETHRAHIQQKLGRTTRADLVRYALDRGLLDER